MSNITDHRIISHEEWIEQRKALLWGVVFAGGQVAGADSLAERGKEKLTKREQRQRAFRRVYIAPRWGARPCKVEQTAARHYHELTHRA